MRRTGLCRHRTRGPYRVLERNEKFFKLQCGEREESVSIDRLKPRVRRSRSTDAARDAAKEREAAEDQGSDAWHGQDEDGGRARSLTTTAKKSEPKQEQSLSRKLRHRPTHRSREGGDRCDPRRGTAWSRTDRDSRQTLGGGGESCSDPQGSYRDPQGSYCASARWIKMIIFPARFSRFSHAIYVISRIVIEQYRAVFPISFN